MTTVEELRAQYGHTWEICTELAIGVAAWRHRGLPKLDGELVNGMVAGDLDELAIKLKEQERAL